jgi:hypothetical protein
VHDTAPTKKTEPAQPISTTAEPIRILESKSVREIIDVLALQSEDAGNPNSTPVNLAAELKSLVESEPERLGKKAGSFKNLKPIFVRSFLSGILRALEGGKEIPWQQVFTLCRSALKQTSEDNQNGEDFNHEESSSGVRSVIARLLAAGFKEGDTEIPSKLRKSAWRLLKPFTDDSQPTPAEEQAWGADSDLSGRALSTVRGNAMHTVIHYARWVQRHLTKEPNGNERSDNSLEEMPEVRKVLEYHLNSQTDPSLAVRSVYGHWLPHLVILDVNWVKQNLLSIFPSNEKERDLRVAAWGTYLRAWDVYKDIFSALSEEYGRAIERLGEDQSERQNSSSLNQRLAEHLIRAYGYGFLTLDDSEGLLARFYANAPDRLCAHVFWHVGYNFHELKEDVHPMVLERFKKLWEKRLSVARADPDAHIKEMTAFGNLFYSAKFDDRWSMGELKSSLEISKWAKPAFFVVQRLATLAPDYPDIAIQCLAHMVEGFKEEGALMSSGLPIRSIISAARHSDADSKQIAINLVHRLGARGHTEFRDLL